MVTGDSLSRKALVPSLPSLYWMEILFYFSFHSYHISETWPAWLLGFSAVWVVGFVGVFFHFPSEKSDVTNALRVYTNLDRKEQICLLKNIPVLLLVAGKV